MKQCNAKYSSHEWIGKKYNMLTVIEPVHPEGATQWMWKVKCDCGKEKIIKPYSVINGKYVSCGCKRAHQKTNLVHGESHTRLHNTWMSMLNRCNPETEHSDGYGKRGIKVCEEWHDYLNFSAWAKSHGYSDDLTIERIDVNGDYCPENCKWIPFAEQARNRRTTKWVEWQGRTMSLAEAAEIAQLPYKQVHFRLKQGWTLEEALTTPLKHGNSDLFEKCKAIGANYHLVYNRIHVYGWDEESALYTPSLGVGANQFNSQDRKHTGTEK